MKKHIWTWTGLLVAGTVLLLGMVALAQASRQVFVNRTQLSDVEVRALETFYNTTIPDGLYWYDPVSGLWGFEGGPAAGRIAPYLDLGGPLTADASGGGTGVYINGRELHPLEVYSL